jgi:hypothetical protein
MSEQFYKSENLLESAEVDKTIEDFHREEKDRYEKGDIPEILKKIESGGLLRATCHSPTPSRRNGGMKMTTKKVFMLEKRFGYFPKLFQMGNTSYVVRNVQRTWTENSRPKKLCFRVQTEQGMIDLAQNTRTNEWRGKTVVES